MDITQAKFLLFEWFSEHDSFSYKNDYSSLPWALLGEGIHRTDECKDAIDICLHEMVENEFLSVKEKGAGTKRDFVYIINESLIDSPVNLLISYKTAQNIARAVEGVIPFLTFDKKVQKIQPRNLNEEHITMLLDLLAFLNKQVHEDLTRQQQIEDNTKNNSSDEDL